MEANDDRLDAEKVVDDDVDEDEDDGAALVSSGPPDERPIICNSRGGDDVICKSTYEWRVLVMIVNALQDCLHPMQTDCSLPTMPDRSLT